MTANQELLHALEYVGGGIFRDSRTPKGSTSLIFHGNDLIKLAKKCELDAMKGGYRKAADKAQTIEDKQQNLYGLQTAQEIKQAILTTAEQLTEKDL